MKCSESGRSAATGGYCNQCVVSHHGVDGGLYGVPLGAGRGDAGAASAEWDAIQSSIDTMMADNILTTVTASSGNAAFILITTPFGSGNTLAAYVRDSATTYCYTWDNTGKILTQVAAVSGACP